MNNRESKEERLKKISERKEVMNAEKVSIPGKMKVKVKKNKKSKKSSKIF